MNKPGVGIYKRKRESKKENTLSTKKVTYLLTYFKKKDRQKKKEGNGKRKLELNK